jgi:phenylalanyl-tRNA synthetase beta chain
VKLSVQWLRELVELPDDLERLCDDLTLLGLEVESVEAVGRRFPGVVVGKVLAQGPHPNADRLSLCRVSDGQTEYPVVCGAPNVRAGLTVAFATPGAVLPNGLEIKKAKIRGEVSLGMICSADELALGDDHSGILELEEDLAAGTPVDRLWGWEDHCIEIEVTPNRPDWLSHIGVARELAARYRTALILPDLGPSVEVADRDGDWTAVCEDEAGCPRYSGRLLRGVTVGESPEWMRRRLEAIGQRPINAVVDCSNYVLHECGQPNHAFDLSRLRGRTILVRRARPGERLVTLDGQERSLKHEHLVIADDEGAVALAGVMGGEATEVGAGTSGLLLEVANFDPGTIRRMRRDLGMNTDASYRFERGVDPALVAWAQRRLAHLITQICGGTASTCFFEGLGRPTRKPAPFFVRAAQVHRVLGVPVPVEEMSGILDRLDIPNEIASEGGREGLRVHPPSFRPDLVEEIDAIEEVARLYGYERIPVAERAPMLRPAERGRGERLRRRLRAHLAARGFHEVGGSSFMESSDPDRLDLEEDDRRRRTVQVLNPLAAGEGHMKTISLPEMLRSVDRNLRRGWTGPIRLFQLDRCFLARPDQALPAEPEHLALIWAGPAEPAYRDRPLREPDPFDAKGELEVLLESQGIEATSQARVDEAFLAPGTGAVLGAGGEVLGRLGVVHPRVLRRYGLDPPVVWAELDLSALERALPGRQRYRPVPVYPPVRRDLSLVVPSQVAYGAVAAVLEETLEELLESCDVFDIYAGEGVEAGHRAVGVRLVLRSAEGTLKDKRVDKAVRRALEALEKRHGVRLRAG